MKTQHYITRLLQAAAITLALIAVCQELEKPKKERKWHGTVAGFIPYEFRMPTLERIREAYWNPYETRIFTPEVFGIGWAVNFFALLEKLRIMVQDDGSEEDFLMPGPHMKEVLTHAVDAEQA